MKKIIKIIATVVIGITLSQFIRTSLPEAATIESYNAEEKHCTEVMEWTDLSDIGINKDEADWEAPKHFNSNDYYKGDGDCNAFRHAYWSGLNIMSMPDEVSRAAGNAHEGIPSNEEKAYENDGKLHDIRIYSIMRFDSHDMAAHYMDAYNNRMGRLEGRFILQQLQKMQDECGIEDYYLKKKVRVHTVPDLVTQNKLDKKYVYTYFDLTDRGRNKFKELLINQLIRDIGSGQLRSLEKDKVTQKYIVAATKGSTLSD